jgi:Antirestriction protein (ArdA)
MDNVDNGAAYFDSRDIEDQIKKLTKERDNPQGLKILNDLKSQYIDLYGESSWEFGARFIRDSYFEEYAQELADDIGAINENAGWPNNYIDWEAAARELQYDYSEVDFDGIAYWTREA